MTHSAQHPSEKVGSEPIYLDHNATTRPLPEVVEAMSRCFRDRYGNPGSRHSAGRAARQALEQARETIAEILGAQPQEVVFTSGGTESINLAIFGLTGNHPHDAARARTSPRVIALTAGEHPATMESCRHLQSCGWKLHTLEVDAGGLLRAEQLAALPWEDLRLVSVIWAHNETGVVQDLAPLSAACREHGVPLHVDAVQAVGKIAVDFRASGAAALSLGAHKFHGPRGIGALLLRQGIPLTPLNFGGHQESQRRPGTEPVALAVGMARALEIWRAEQDNRTRYVSELRDRLEGGLQAACPPVVVNGSPSHRLPNTSNVSFPGIDGEAFLVAIDLEGVCCSLGSTCASGSTEPAPALVAMGCPPEVCRSSVRFSVGVENNTDEVDEAVRRIARIVTRLRETA